MAVKTAQYIFNGQTINLTYNSTSGKWEATVTAPSKSSYSQTDHVLGGTVTIVNIILGWNVWDYSNLPGNLLGQICPQFTVLWFFLSAVAVYLDDWIRYLLWGENGQNINFRKEGLK